MLEILLCCKRLEARVHIAQSVLPFCSSDKAPTVSELHKPHSLEPRLTSRARLPPVLCKAVCKCSCGRGSLVPSLEEFALTWILFQRGPWLYCNTAIKSARQRKKSLSSYCTVILIFSSKRDVKLFLKLPLTHKDVGYEGLGFSFSSFYCLCKWFFLICFCS